MKPLSFERLCSLPQACKPSQADWLNDLSSTPPVSVTIAAFVFTSEDESALREERLPHAASPTAATATRPRPSHCFLFITEPPK